jgi:hypothetical protein
MKISKLLIAYGDSYHFHKQKRYYDDNSNLDFPGAVRHAGVLASNSGVRCTRQYAAVRNRTTEYNNCAIVVVRNDARGAQLCMG